MRPGNNSFLHCSWRWKEGKFSFLCSSYHQFVIHFYVNINKCTYLGCDKGARDKKFCAAHGGGKRVSVASHFNDSFNISYGMFIRFSIVGYSNTSVHIRVVLSRQLVENCAPVMVEERG